MKYITINLIAFLLFYLIKFPAAGQKKDPTPEFQTLKLNSSPAYVMLGVEPENIQRPSSPSQFIGGIQNAVVNKRLKPNMAFEATPYYWKNPKKDSTRFEAKEFLLPEKNIFNSIYKTFTLSLGTSESDTVAFGKLRPGTGLGAGIRFIVVDGKPQGENIKRLMKWNRLIHRQALLSTIMDNISTKDGDIKNETIIEDAIKNYLRSIGDEKSIYNLAGLYDTDEFVKELKSDISKSSHLKDVDFINALNAVSQTEKAEESKLLVAINKSKLPFAKTGFILEFAAGSAFIFQNNSFDSSKHARTSMWLTPSYRWEVNKDKESISLLDVAGVLRLTFNNKADSVDIANYLDAGVKFQYTHNRWSVSSEAVYRRASKLPEGFNKKFTCRFVTSLDYKMSDGVTFKFSFGSNFDGNTATYTDSKKMFAVGGLNLGIFNSKQK